MKYSITYQYKPKGFERTTGDYFPIDQELESEKGNEYIPIPNIGDFVQFVAMKSEIEGFENYYNRDYKVIYRSFKYLKDICIVIITLTDVEEQEEAFYRYRD